MKELEEKFAECIARFGSTLNSNEIRNLATDLVSLLPDYGKQILDLGRESYAAVQGWYPEDFTEDEGPFTIDKAFAAIKYEIELGRKSFSELRNYGSQPNKWGLAVEKECDESNIFFVADDKCHLRKCKCSGTGFITRTLTTDEAGELLKPLLNLYEQQGHGPYLLSMHERIIVKEKP